MDRRQIDGSGQLRAPDLETEILEAMPRSHSVSSAPATEFRWKIAAT
jgi:hypothetical protein